MIFITAFPPYTELTIGFSQPSYTFVEVDNTTQNQVCVNISNGTLVGTVGFTAMIVYETDMTAGNTYSSEMSIQRVRTIRVNRFLQQTQALLLVKTFGNECAKKKVRSGI